VRTEFSQRNMDDSHKAHLAARTQFYPLLFPGCDLAFEDTANTKQDLSYAIDCLVSVSNPRLGLRAPLYFAVQERWRLDLDAMRWGDVTVTEWNLASDCPSELHKLGAHWLVYGFYDKARDQIVCAAVVDVTRLVYALALGLLAYERRPRGDQTFLAFPIAALREQGAVIKVMRLAEEKAA
jgi:hypothetical protein